MPRLVWAPCPSPSAARFSPRPSLPRSPKIGEERTAAVGGVRSCTRSATSRYPLIAILEGEAAILDAAGNEIIRHGASGFLGEINLLSGSDRLPDRGRRPSRCVTSPLTWLPSGGCSPRTARLPTSCSSTFMQRRETAPAARRGRARDRRPAVSSDETRRAGRLRPPHAPPAHLARPGTRRRSGGGVADFRPRPPRSCRWSACQAGLELQNPSNGEVSRTLGIGL